MLKTVVRKEKRKRRVPRSRELAEKTKTWNEPERPSREEPVPVKSEQRSTRFDLD